MNRRLKLQTLALVATAITLAGCSSTRPVPYSEWPTSTQLVANTQDDAYKTPYAFSAPENLSQYRSVIIDPVAIYQGKDNQFEDLTDEEKTELAKFMRTEFEKTLGAHFQITTTPGPQVLRLALTLTGATANTAMVSTVTRFDLLGGPTNVVQSIRGKEGTFLGTVSYAAEIRDASDDKLLRAFVTKQYPNALNVGASFGRLGAAKTGVELGAQDMLTRLQ